LKQKEFGTWLIRGIERKDKKKKKGKSGMDGFEKIQTRKAELINLL
jgi:hypothetical protein